MNKAIELISHGSVSPLRSQLSMPLENSKQPTARYYKRKALETTDALMNAIAPNQGLKLKKIVMDTQTIPQNNNQEVLKVLCQLYANSKDNSSRCQVLSLIVNQYPKSELLAIFPNITKYQIDKARKHAFVFGPGAVIRTEPTKHNRQRMDISKISHAIEFFSDPSFLQIVFYGTRDLKLDSGEILTIPEVIRTMMHSNLVSLYTSYCTENSFSPLSNSTLFQILKACAASKRTCLKGLTT